MKRFALIALLAACKRDAAPVADASVASPSGRPAEAQFVLTPQKLDAYLKYLEAQKAAAGSAVERAERDEAALKRLGLSEFDFEQIDSLVASVVARRMVSQVSAGVAITPDNASLDGLDAETRKRVQGAMEQFKTQAAEATHLTVERQRFGSKNVDVLLAREAEVTRAWQDMMQIGALPAFPTGDAVDAGP